MRRLAPHSAVRVYSRMRSISASWLAVSCRPAAAAFACTCAGCVAPAIIATKNLYHDQPEEMRKLWVSRVPMGRPGTPEEVAAMIAWLASEDCSFTTGAAFDLSGGRATY